MFSNVIYTPELNFEYKVILSYRFDTLCTSVHSYKLTPFFICNKNKLLRSYITSPWLDCDEYLTAVRNCEINLSNVLDCIVRRSSGTT